ncbi:hypothetical protein R1sor_009185 [Riccia sorocarpa]|uniref:FCP1 homology domain-containing protein n=1 Tax=Riccia sorocarpa TaxID=122646 RepID=A0ABD3H710_9MARC
MSLHLMLKKMIAPKRKKKPRKKTSVDVLPSQVKIGLQRFHCAKHGETAPQRLEPLEILRIKDISQYQLTLDEKLPCKLVFLDLTHPDFLAWERQEFSCFLDIVRKLTVATEFAIVAIMDFGQQMLLNFSSEGSTVLDFFSGGVFAREALMLQRDVIYFANSQEEAEFVGKYGKSLVSYSERVRHWFAKYKSAKIEQPASMIEQPAILAKEHANTQDDHIPADQKEKASFVFDEVFTTDALERLGNRPRLQLTADGEPEDVDNVHSNHPRSLDPAEHTIKKQDSSDQGSLFQAVQQRNVQECEEDGPLALALNYYRSLGSSHFDDLETVPLVQSREPSVKLNVPIIPSQTLHLNENDLGLEDLILELVEQADDGGPLALIQMSVCPAPDFMQMDNPLVKPSDMLLRKLLILDVEGLLLYAEGFMDRTSKTAAGDVIGAKKVIRRNGVQEFITRCFELFDIALWTCSDHNLLYDYTYYLFSGEQYGKFLFRWDQGKALDTNERWTRNHREIRLLLKPLKTIWETFPDFNARNTLLVDVNPYRASANPVSCCCPF